MINGLLTREEVAERLGVVPNSVTRLVREGMLRPAGRSGQRPLFEPDAVPAYFAACKERYEVPKARELSARSFRKRQAAAMEYLRQVRRI
jgi:predicted site-specific integrase-resolvase